VYNTRLDKWACLFVIVFLVLLFIPLSANAENVKVKVSGTAIANKVQMTQTGEFSFSLGETISSSGKGSVTGSFSGYDSSGLVYCTIQGTATTTYSVTGKNLSSVGKVSLSLTGATPSPLQISMSCKNTNVQNAPHDITNPFNFGGSSIEIEPMVGATASKTISIPGGQATWQFSIIERGGSTFESFDDFDFDVDVQSFDEIVQGETANIRVIVKLLKGQAETVQLFTTQYTKQDITAFLTPSKVAAGQVSTLQIKTSCDTSPDRYLFTIFGSPVGSKTFRSSEDAVSVNIKPNPNCENLVGSGETNINNLFDQGFAAGDTGNYPKAISFFNKVLDVDPDNVDALAYIGLMYSFLGVYQTAIDYYNKALENAPGDTIDETLILSFKSDAEKQLNPEKTITTVPTPSPPTSNMVLNEINGCRQSDSNAQLNCLKDLLEKYPNDPEVLIQIGVSYGTLGNYDQSIIFFEKSYAENPNADPLVVIGMTYLEIDDYNNAINYYLKAITDFPKAKLTEIAILDISYLCDKKNVERACELRSNDFVEQVPVQTVKDIVPNWIKNTAKWWCEGTINDQEFVNALQYLISEGIIIIPPTQSGQATSQDIPEWIKNNACWWADGLIDDSEFIAGIQYLIQEGIIIV